MPVAQRRRRTSAGSVRIHACRISPGTTSRALRVTFLADAHARAAGVPHSSGSITHLGPAAGAAGRRPMLRAPRLRGRRGARSSPAAVVRWHHRGVERDRRGRARRARAHVSTRSERVPTGPCTGREPPRPRLQSARRSSGETTGAGHRDRGGRSGSADSVNISHRDAKTPAKKHRLQATRSGRRTGRLGRRQFQPVHQGRSELRRRERIASSSIRRPGEARFLDPHSCEDLFPRAVEGQKHSTGPSASNGR